MVVFRDDGCGIADPKSLLTLGGSDWENETLRREEPAGMGFFSLSQRTCSITSRTPDAKIGWTMRLEPDQFCSRAPVLVKPFDTRPGTEIMFVYDGARPVSNTLEAAARYCLTPVYLDGERLEQKDFLENDHHIELWRGIRIGVFRRCYGHYETRINFHGLTLSAPLPDVTTAMERDTYSVCLDILDCPDLKLVLPARKEVVQDAFFDELKTAARWAIYRPVFWDACSVLTTIAKELVEEGEYDCEDEAFEAACRRDDLSFYFDDFLSDLERILDHISADCHYFIKGRNMGRWQLSGSLGVTANTAREFIDKTLVNGP